MERIKRFIVAGIVASSLLGTASGAAAGTVEDRDKIITGQQQTSSYGR